MEMTVLYLRQMLLREKNYKVIIQFREMHPRRAASCAWDWDATPLGWWGAGS